MADDKQQRLLKPYQLITDRIIELLEAGTVPWRRPWRADIAEPRNLHSGKHYRGINIFMLEATAAAVGYASPYWVTFRQAIERGGNVRKGEKATPVVFWKILGGRDTGDDDDADDGATANAGPRRGVPLLRHYHVFNVEQCEGLDYPRPTAGPDLDFDPIIAAESIVAAMPNPPTIGHGQPRAAYYPARDHINMPRRETFTAEAEYYSTLFHEMIHATGHARRLARPGITVHASFGSAPYAKEELVAEMGAAFLCGRARIETATLENSAAYIRGWLQKLRDDPKLVVHAAANAQKAADYVLGVKEREASQTFEQGVARGGWRER